MTQPIEYKELLRHYSKGREHKLITRLNVLLLNDLDPLTMAVKTEIVVAHSPEYYWAVRIAQLEFREYGYKFSFTWHLLNQDQIKFVITIWR